MDWVAKYIMEMKDQGFTRIACMGMKLFDMHIMEEGPHKFPILKKNLYLNKMVDYTPL